MKLMNAGIEQENVSVLGCLATTELTNSHGNVRYARHLEKGTDQHGRLQTLMLKEQVFLGMVVHVCDPSPWEMEGK